MSTSPSGPKDFSGDFYDHPRVMEEAFSAIRRFFAENPEFIYSIDVDDNVHVPRPERESVVYPGIEPYCKKGTIAVKIKTKGRNPEFLYFCSGRGVTLSVNQAERTIVYYSQSDRYTLKFRAVDEAWKKAHPPSKTDFVEFLSCGNEQMERALEAVTELFTPPNVTMAITVTEFEERKPLPAKHYPLAVLKRRNALSRVDREDSESCSFSLKCLVGPGQIVTITFKAGFRSGLLRVDQKARTLYYEEEDHIIVQIKINGQVTEF